MKLKKFRKKSKKQLRGDLVKERKGLAEIRFNIRVGKEKDYSQVRWNKKEIARILTVLQEEDKNGQDVISKEKKGDNSSKREDKKDLSINKDEKNKKEK